MKIDVRFKLFFISLVVIAVSIFGAEWYIDKIFARAIAKRAEVELDRLLRILKNDLELVQQRFPLLSYHEIARRFSGSADLRISIIAPTGAILGDSELELHELSTTENYGNRPEVIAALARGKGAGWRWDNGDGVDYLHMAVLFDKNSARNVLRVSMPISAVSGLHDDIHLAMVGVGFWPLSSLAA